MSDLSVSTDDIDLLDSVSSRSQSPTSMALPSAVNSPSAISGHDEKETASSTILTFHEDNGDNVESAMSEHPIVHPDVTIDSFLPLLQALNSPGLQLIDGKYHLRGFISDDSFKKLSDYARSVTKFTLNDAHSLVEAGTLFRLVQLGARYNKDNAFFPSLKTRLHIDTNKPETSLSLLPLFLVPTLEVLEVENIPESQYDTFLTFLDTLADEAPHLSSIRVGTNLSYDALHPTCMRFVNLRELKLSNVGSILNWSTLQDLGQLPELETLVLNARATSYRSYLEDVLYDIPQQPSLPASAVETLEPPSTRDEWGFGNQSAFDNQSLFGNPQPVSQINNFNFGENIEPVPEMPPLPRLPSPSPSIPAADEPEKSKPSTHATEPAESKPPSPKGGFCKLMTLHVVAKVDLMSALVDLTKSLKLVDVSLTLVAYPLKKGGKKKRGMTETKEHVAVATAPKSFEAH